MATETAPQNGGSRRDVASAAGVSEATVSHVMNGKADRVSAATAVRVQDAARRLGYVPNAQARALRLGRTESIGVCIPDVNNALYADLASELERAARERGRSVTMHFTRDAELPEFERVLARVDGLIFVPTSRYPDLSLIRSQRVPTVVFEKVIAGYTAIVPDFEAGTLRAVRHLLEHTGAPVGLIAGDDALGTSHRREVGWLRAHREAGIEPGPIARAEYSFAGGLDAARALLDSAERPNAVFASSDAQGLGVLRAAYDRGIRIPHDLRVATFDGSTASAQAVPPLTSLVQPLRAMANQALDCLASAETGRTFTFETELALRDSCGCSHTIATHERI